MKLIAFVPPWGRSRRVRRDNLPGIIIRASAHTAIWLLCLLSFRAWSADCVAPPVGLVAWWLGEGNANDIVGSHNGTLQGGATFASGKVRQAFSLNGSSGYIQVPDSDLWAFGTNSFTIELWAYFNAVPPGPLGMPQGGVFIGNDEIGGSGQKKWFFALGGGVLNFHINYPSVGAAFLVLAPFTPSLQQWYHLAVVRSINLFTIFVNGAPLGSEASNLSVPNADAPLTIGQAEGFFFNGRLDEVSLYHRALSAPEIAAIYSAGSAGKCAGPTITSQPQNTTVLLNSPTNFVVTAVGSAPLSYQWLLYGTNISGATNSSLAFPSSQLTNAGVYSVVVNNALGVTTSSNAVLQVLPLGAPSIQVNTVPAVGTMIFTASVEVSILGGFPDGFIFYTLDGSVPSVGSPLYDGPISLTNSATIQAMSLSSDLSQTAFAPSVNVRVVPLYALQTAVTGSGMITANPPSGPYLSNSVVTLTATPSAIWLFGHWTGDASGNENPLSVTMNGPRSVQAVFLPIPFYSLNTSVLGSGTLSMNPTNGPYLSNSVVTVTANGTADWPFDHWTGDASGNQNPLSVTMDGPRSVQAVFVRNYPVTVSTPGGGGVTVNGQVITPGTFYPAGSVQSLLATPSSGWSFLGWQGDASGTNNPLSLMVNQTNNIQAIFGTAVGTSPVGVGTIVLNQPNPIPYGTALTASVIPGAGNYFLSWGGAASGTNAPTTITVTSANPTISALFSTLPGGKYSLGVVVMGAGAVATSPQKNYYNSGETVSLSATPVPGATSFYGWTHDASGTNSALAVVMTTNKTVQANFGALPVVSISPTSLIVQVGSNAVLSAIAGGLPPLTYQWQSSQGAIAGATNAIFTILDIQGTNAGNYSVIVSSPFGSATSAVATVTVAFPPSITQEPRSWTVASGTVLDLNVSASGTEPLSYLWRNSSGEIAGATNATYTLNPVQTNNADGYFVVVTNLYGCVTSAVATVTVYVPVSITAQPASQIVPARSTVWLSVVAGGYPAPAYQWTFNGTNMPGATSSALTITNVLLPRLGDYAVLVGNGYSSQLSATATLSMSPSLTSPFIGATAIWGTSAVLSVGAIGSGEMGYQWYQGGLAVEGATNATLNFPNIQFRDGGMYSVVVSSPFGIITNVAAQVVVNPAGISLGFSPTLTITGAVGYAYIIQSSVNLSDTNAWITLTNLTLTEPEQIWVDTSVDAASPFYSKYFYRVLPGQ